MKTALFRLIYWITRLLRPAPSQPTAPTFLILQYQMPLGCCVHGTPLYAVLKSQHPGATVIVATRGLAAAVLQHDPNVDHLILTADPMPSLSSRLQVAKQLRSKLSQLNLHPTLVLQDASSKAGSFALFAALLRLAPTKGFAHAPGLYDTHLDYDWNRSLIDNNLRLADSPHVEPAVYFTAQDLAHVRSIVQECNPEARPLAAFVMFGSGAQPTSWRDEHFAAVLRHAESLGMLPVCLGTPADIAPIQAIIDLSGSNAVCVAGRTTIPQLAALLSLCDLMVSVDTGGMHIGRAVKLPMVVLGPSWQKPLEWLPLDVPSAIVLRGTDRTDVPLNYQLDEITVPEVVAAVNATYASYPPSLQARQDRVDRLLSTARA